LFEEIKEKAQMRATRDVPLLVLVPGKRKTNKMKIKL
jgi:vacuolar-type H+-ATPase subunit F/Vma7